MTKSKKINLNEVVKLTLNEVEKNGWKGHSQQEIRVILESFVSVIKKNVKKGVRVSITDFGIFWKSTIKPRVGVNPQTGEKIKIDGKNTPRFTASKNFDMTKYTGKK